MKTKIEEKNGKWCLVNGDNVVEMVPQPNLGQLRFDGNEWTVYMGYPQGHDIPVWNSNGYWRKEEFMLAKSAMIIRDTADTR